MATNEAFGSPAPEQFSRPCARGPEPRDPDLEQPTLSSPRGSATRRRLIHAHAHHASLSLVISLIAFAPCVLLSRGPYLTRPPQPRQPFLSTRAHNRDNYDTLRSPPLSA